MHLFLKYAFVLYIERELQLTQQNKIITIYQIPSLGMHHFHHSPAFSCVFKCNKLPFGRIHASK